MSWMISQYPEIGITDDTLTPVVAECDDGRLNDKAVMLRKQTS